MAESNYSSSDDDYEEPYGNFDNPLDHIVEISIYESQDCLSRARKKRRADFKAKIARLTQEFRDEERLLRVNRVDTFLGTIQERIFRN